MQPATISIQHQNLKTFLTAFIGMLVAVPIVAMVTVAVVKAELGSAAFAAPTTTQSNNMPAPVAVGPSCTVPAESSAAKVAPAGVPGVWGYGSVSNSFNQTNTSTTTTNSSYSKVVSKSYSDSFNKTFVIGSNNNNGSQNGNTVGSNNGNNNTTASNNTTSSNNTTTTASNNTTSTNSGNTSTAVSNVNTNSNNTAVNSGNTVNNDNDVVDIL